MKFKVGDVVEDARFLGKGVVVEIDKRFVYVRFYDYQHYLDTNEQLDSHPRKPSDLRKLTKLEKALK